MSTFHMAWACWAPVEEWLQGAPHLKAICFPLVDLKEVKSTLAAAVALRALS